MPPVARPSRARRRHFLREWREFAGKTQEQAAEAVGKHQSAISSIESGKIAYDQDELEVLAELYGTTPQALISRDPNDDDLASMVEGLDPNARAIVSGFLKNRAR